ncbi:ATPase family AAA domain-containing protein 3B [Psilocybe cubensis]|uniref:AAA+ ATPase domain-containing protein n=2 Tax=Psilocybe cubensis TaxID=181762 RepID=A0A8H8CRA2_PSICU|nr:ATPase family AAA domain-containing protein 3B [Psilocybe cubensis]KAH9487460.1 ATPase family AAA domain-containing protein 3B [Psilocybe cubensis]
MHRRFSSLVKNPPGGSSSRTNEITIEDDGESKVSTIVREEPLPPVSLKVKRVDFYYSRWTKSWKYRNTSSKVTVETIPIMQGASNDAWKEFCFVIVRTMPRRENFDPTFKVVIKSEYLLKACKDVIKSWPGISWNSDPLELDPEIFITFQPKFLEYASELAAKKARTHEENNVLASVNLLTETIASDYRVTMATIERLIQHGEITFDLLYAILVPRDLMVTKCPITGSPRLFQLTSWIRTSIEGKPMYQLNLESVDLVDRQITHSVVVGRVQTTVYLKPMRGTVKIDTLDAYPMKFHSDPQGLKETILKRGQKWVSLIGVHHKQFDGIAALKAGDKLLKHNVRSRIMIDRATFRRLNANYAVPNPVPPKTEENIHIPGFGQQYDRYGNPIPEAAPPVNPPEHLVQLSSSDSTADVELNEQDLLLTPTVVFGFSLSDKMWLEFDVDKIKDVDWSEDAFSNLVLPGDRKNLLQSLVEAHHKEVGFDDFIKGKGHGLVINLFGPPGVGKTFSAEATSEHVRRPLYVIGGGDLGTSAAALDVSLERIFDVATAWKAIVLIDEADVFLEQRSLHDLERNAMVAIFLRHVEYYRGILFLTTNRVKAFDEAFLSRIHVALHFRELTQESKEQVWTAFIKKMGPAASGITKEQITELAKRGINGRQIKNAARTAHSLAVAKGESVCFEHLIMTLDALDEFTKEFEKRNQFNMYA